MATEPKLPSAIRAQVAQAEELQRVLDAVTPSANTSIQDVLANAPAPTPVAAPTPAPAPAPVASAPAPISREELDQLMQTQTAVRDFLARSSATPAPAPVPSPAPAPTQVATPAPAPAAKDDPRDVDTFGADVLDMVNRKVNAATEHLAESVRVMFQRLNQRLDALTGDVTSTSQKVQVSAAQMVMNTLDRAVPTWREINVSAGFLKWLGQIDPMTRETRQSALDRATAANDADWIATFFTAYESTKAPAPAPAEQNKDLAALVSPDTVAAAAPAPAAESPFITSAQVQSFYDDLRRGKYAGKEAEAKRIADAIDLAGAQGRITR